MTAIAPHITTFLRERLPVQRGASVHTCDSYAYAFQLLFEFASQQYRVPPSGLQLEQIDAPLVLAFLDHLEAKRGNSPSTRNVRLAAIKSFMRFCEYRVPSLLEQRTLPISASVWAFEIGPCSIWPLPQGYASRNWWAYPWEP